MSARPSLHTLRSLVRPCIRHVRLSVTVYVCPSDCPFVRCPNLCLYISACLQISAFTPRRQLVYRHRSSVRPSVRPFVRPFVRPSDRSPVRSSVRPPVRPSVRSFVRPSVRPSARPPARPSRTTVPNRINPVCIEHNRSIGSTRLQ